jgi:hypothetical protein
MGRAFSWVACTHASSKEHVAPTPTSARSLGRHRRPASPQGRWTSGDTPEGVASALQRHKEGSRGDSHLLVEKSIHTDQESVRIIYLLILNLNVTEYPL